MTIENNPKTCYVYLLSCADDTLYCGYTVNLEKRISEHNKGKGAKYTRGRTPVALVYFEEFTSKGDALKREYQIKKLSKAQKKALYEKN